MDFSLFIGRLFGNFSPPELKAVPPATGLGPDDEERIRREIELEVLERFKEYRNSLQKYKEKLDVIKYELEHMQSEKVEELKRTSLALKREIYRLNHEIEIKRGEESEAKEFVAAVYRTSAKEMDWLKRAEKKEIKIFSEMQRELEKLNSPGGFHGNGYEFEEYCARLLMGNGFSSVSVTQKSQDFGVDICAEKDGVKYAIQCKYYSHPVGIESVQQIFTGKVHYSAHVAVVITNNVFTKAAKILAEESGILLWDCGKIKEMERTLRPEFKVKMLPKTSYETSNQNT